MLIWCIMRWNPANILNFPSLIKGWVNPCLSRKSAAYKSQKIGSEQSWQSYRFLEKNDKLGSIGANARDVVKRCQNPLHTRSSQGMQRMENYHSGEAFLARRKRLLFDWEFSSFNNIIRFSQGEVENTENVNQHLLWPSDGNGETAL